MIYLSGGAKWKNLPDFFLLFPIFSHFFLIFSLFFLIETRYRDSNLLVITQCRVASNFPDAELDTYVTKYKFLSNFLFNSSEL